MFQFGNLNSFKVNKQTNYRHVSTGGKEKKTKLVATTLPGFKDNLYASVALHAMSSQVYLGANKTTCTSLVTIVYL